MPCRTSALALLLLANAFAAASPVPVAYVAVRSADGAREAFEHLAPLAGKESWPAAVEAFLRLRTGGVSLDGLDGKRPLGAYLLWPADLHDLVSFKAPVVLYAPISDEKKFLGMLDKLGCKPRRADSNFYQVAVPGLPELSLRFAHGHAFAASRADLLREPCAPDTFLPTGGPQSLLSAALRVEQFPPRAAQDLAAAVKSALEELGASQAFAQFSTRLPGETEANFQARKAQMDLLQPGSPLWPRIITGFLGEFRDVALALDLDSGRHWLAIDLAVRPRPDTALAEFCAYAGSARSRWTPLTAGAEGSLVLHIPAVASWREAAGRVKIDTELPRLLRDYVDARLGEVVVRSLQVFVHTLVADGLDLCVVARPRHPGEEAVALAGLQLHRGRRLDHLVRDYVKDLPAADKAELKVRWNHDRHARAHIHRFETGSTSAVLLAVRDDLALVGFDDKSLAALKDALDAHDKATPAPTPLLQAEVAASFFDDDKAFAEAVKKLVPKGQQSSVRARLRLEGGKDLRLRLESSTYWIPLARKLGH
jgi:hypothetical protein